MLLIDDAAPTCAVLLEFALTYPPCTYLRDSHRRDAIRGARSRVHQHVRERVAAGRQAGRSSRSVRSAAVESCHGRAVVYTLPRTPENAENVPEVYRYFYYFTNIICLFY